MRAKKSKRSVLFSGVVMALVVSVAALTAVDRQIRPIVQSVSEIQGRGLATQIISSSVHDTLSEPQISGDDWVQITYDMNGGITSVQTNVSKMNQMQARISMAVNTDMKDMEDATIEIPLGTLSGLTYFNGQGPVFKFKVRQQGYVKTQLTSTFTSAGINQTLHQIVLTVDAQAIAIVPTNYTEFSVSATYILAETVLVGNVPDGYTYVIGDDRDSLTKIDDYSNQ